jgi:hypothetical protein
MNEAAFSPINPLEVSLLQAQLGSGPASDFFDELLGSQVFVLLDKDLGPDGQWDPSINLCVLTNAAGKPVLAAFTAAERSAQWYQHLPQFQYGLLVSFVWLMQGLGPDVGVVINPGHAVGVELAPEAIARFKQQARGESPAS